MSSQSQITKSKSQQGTTIKSWWKCQTKEVELQRLHLSELWAAEYKILIYEIIKKIESMLKKERGSQMCIRQMWKCSK